RKNMFRAGKGWSCFMLMLFATFASTPAGATTLHLLVKADLYGANTEALAENTRVLTEKMQHLPMNSCKPDRPVPIRGDEIIMVLLCEPKNDSIDIILKLSQLERIKSVILFAVDNNQ